VELQDILSRGILVASPDHSRILLLSAGESFLRHGTAGRGGRGLPKFSGRSKVQSGHFAERDFLFAFPCGSMPSL